jgi:hypothetical protein
MSQSAASDVFSSPLACEHCRVWNCTAPWRMLPRHARPWTMPAFTQHACPTASCTCSVTPAVRALRLLHRQPPVSRSKKFAHVVMAVRAQPKTASPCGARPRAGVRGRRGWPAGRQRRRRGRRHAQRAALHVPGARARAGAGPGRARRGHPLPRRAAGPAGAARRRGGCDAALAAVMLGVTPAANARAAAMPCSWARWRGLSPQGHWSLRSLR